MKSCPSTARLALRALFVLATVAACSRANGPTPPAGDAGVAGDGDACDDGSPALPRVVLGDEMNYVFHSSLRATTTVVRANSDLTFDWSAATVDMLGRKMDPFADVDMVQLMLWRYDEDTFLSAINREDLSLGRLLAMGYCDAQHLRTHCNFFELLAPAGSPIAQDELLEYVNPASYPPSKHLWVVMLATGRTFGQGTRLLAFLRPSESETNDQVRLTNDSTSLSYTVDLASLAPIALPRPGAEVVLAWNDDSRLTKNGMGDRWIATRITDVAVARYVGYERVDLERQFLLLQDLASEQYGVRLNAGQEVELSRLTSRTGTPFSGVDDTGIWLLSLTCGSCRNPAPWFLSILRPPAQDLFAGRASAGK